MFYVSLQLWFLGIWGTTMFSSWKYALSFKTLLPSIRTRNCEIRVVTIIQSRHIKQWDFIMTFALIELQNALSGLSESRHEASTGFLRNSWPQLTHHQTRQSSAVAEHPTCAPEVSVPTCLSLSACDAQSHITQLSVSKSDILQTR